ncbi:aminotransferase [Malaciobacter molluscorum LMG 25693]|uniref:cysteine-S-conjugate beta-lyase n=1 Tax=Malaciobacter molluscorum LMG 25693 TaxID=870501 RepID=A0A2G1DHM9_9BACT|nr:aminotransferase [Malaciobacter molluscorum LMG 25693]RXJ95207.1 aminotransferase [Malaciobacter molluscorum]
MNYNFDEKIDRKNTDCVKYDGLKKFFNVDDAKPLWVADMDFKTPDFILEDLKKCFDKQILGYPIITDRIYESIIYWYKKRHNINSFSKDDIQFTTGVVTALSACIEALSNEEDEVIIQTPVYFPFYSVVKDNNRKLILNPLTNENDYYTMDFENLKSKISKKTKLLILCSPHNPVGRVWSKEELEELMQICYENNIIIISDEIHSDLVFKKFTSILHLDEKYFDNIVLLNSPSKTFNLAGLKSSYIITKNNKIRASIEKILIKRHITTPNIFGIESIASSYNKGEQWLDMLLKYIKNNLEILNNNLNDNITFKEPEATYLIWLNFKKIEDTHKNIFQRLLHNSGLALNDGITFGEEGNKYFRLNISLPNKELKEALIELNNEFS